MRIPFRLAALSLTIAATYSAHGTELSYLYKDPRNMGMGGAGLAVGGLNTAVFDNPAGLANIEQNRLMVDLLGLSVSGSENVENVITDINDASKEDNNTEAIVKVFDDYSGSTFHFDLSNYSSLSMNNGTSAWTVGILGVADGNITPHSNGGVQGLLETQSRVYAGVTAGYGHNLNLGQHTLKLGVGAKYIKQKSFEGTISPSDIISAEDVADAISDKLEKDGSAFAVDLGAIYQMSSKIAMKPSFALSIMNIGKLDFNDAYGSQPTTVNIGMAIQPDLGTLTHTVVALDYVDLFNANKTRYYNLDSITGDVTYTEVKDKDVVKRIRFGAKTRLYDVGWSSMDVSAGLYQGNISGGLQLQASVVTIGLSTYVEQLGPKSGDYDDRRYTVNLGINW